jgi:uncharacterized Zn-binding protein involved in type VI secretion
MPSVPVVRVGDSLSHGGSVTAGSPTTKSEGAPIARVGDACTCNIHGSTTISTGSPLLKDNGVAVALDGAAAACGASISAVGTLWISE